MCQAQPERNAVKLIDRRIAAATTVIFGLLLADAWFGANAYAYEVETHAAISEAAATNSLLTAPVGSAVLVCLAEHGDGAT